MDRALEKLWVLFDQGGAVLWMILVVSVLMWTLIVERYWYLWLVLPGFSENLRRDWITSDKPDILSRSRLRDSLVSRFRSRAGRFVASIQTLTGVLPLLGLLGTVSGMIQVFDVMTVFGTGNSRGMAAGISEALITTLAGLLTAIAGIYFATNLQSRVEQAVERFEATLTFD